MDILSETKPLMNFVFCGTGSIGVIFLSASGIRGINSEGSRSELLPFEPIIFLGAIKALSFEAEFG